MAIFEDGHLFIWDEEALIKAEDELITELVTSIRVGAKCYSKIGLNNIYKRLSKYENVKKIVVADDRILDPDMPQVQSQFEKIFPKASFEWSYDLLVGGKHGR